MNFLFITRQNTGCDYYRMVYPARAISRLKGHKARIFPDKNFKIFHLSDKILTWADVVILHRVYGESPFITKLLFNLVRQVKQKRKILGYDVDDDLPHIDEESKASEEFSQECAKQVILLTNNADIITTTTNYLKDTIANYNEGWKDKIYIFPNCLPFSNFKFTFSSKHNKIRIGITGGTTHLSDWQKFYPIVKEIQKNFIKKNFTVEWHLFGFSPEMQSDLNKNLTKLAPSFSQKIKSSPWYQKANFVIKNYKELGFKFHKLVNFSQYFKVLRSLGLNITLIYLEDHHFNRCKSSIKWIEHLVVGSAVIVQKGTVYEKYVLESKGGLVASSINDWINLTYELVRDKAKRKELVNNGQKFIKENFDIDKKIKDYVKIYENINAH